MATLVRDLYIRVFKKVQVVSEGKVVENTTKNISHPW